MHFASLLSFACTKESNKEKCSQIEILFLKARVTIAIWRREIHPRSDYLELMLSANFGKPGRWFFSPE
jgi:hypothetical protein